MTDTLSINDQHALYFLRHWLRDKYLWESFAFPNIQGCVDEFYSGNLTEDQFEQHMHAQALGYLTLEKNADISRQVLIRWYQGRNIATSNVNPLPDEPIPRNDRLALQVLRQWFDARAEMDDIIQYVQTMRDLYLETDFDKYHDANLKSLVLKTTCHAKIQKAWNMLEQWRAGNNILLVKLSSND